MYVLYIDVKFMIIIYVCIARVLYSTCMHILYIPTLVEGTVASCYKKCFTINQENFVIKIFSLLAASANKLYELAI